MEDLRFVNFERDYKERKIYIAECWTSDPEIKGDTSRVAILGAFSTRELAEDAFTHEEKVTEKDGEIWIRKHICFRGSHEIKEYELNKWRPIGD